MQNAFNVDSCDCFAGVYSNSILHLYVCNGMFEQRIMWCNSLQFYNAYIFILSRCWWHCYICDWKSIYFTNTISEHKINYFLHILFSVKFNYLWSSWHCFEHFKSNIVYWAEYIQSCSDIWTIETLDYKFSKKFFYRVYCIVHWPMNRMQTFLIVWTKDFK